MLAARVIPLRDTAPPARVPLVNWALIALNVAVFWWEATLGTRAEAFVRTWGLVPRDLEVRTLVTSMFLHGGLGHLAGNMLFLHIFGDNVEGRLGHLRFALLYLLAGVAAGLAQVLADPTSDVPMIGASGAIAGVSGAYFLFFPTARVLTLVPILFFVRLVEVPAVVFLLVWFGWQLLSALGAEGAAGGVAFWAHVGGFVAGTALGPLLALGLRRRRAN